MVIPAHRIDYTLEDYVALEAASSTKHEFLAGQIYGMAGGTPEHAALKAALTGLLFPQLRGGHCRLYDADLRVRVVSSGLSTYPDLTVICGPAERDEADKASIVNPKLLVEVTSASTQAYDRGDKLEHYKSIPTLQHYLLVSHEARQLELWDRMADGSWALTILGDGEVAHLRSLNATLAVAELYSAAGL